MDKGKNLIPSLAFLYLCLSFGTSYAVVSKAIQYMNGVVLHCLRMWFAFYSALILFCIKLIFQKNYYIEAVTSIRSGDSSLIKAMLCGILNYGLPHSLVTICQRSVPSVAVQIAQPCISFFTMFAAHFCLLDEKITKKKVLAQIIALVGTVLTTIPTLISSNDIKKISNPFDYFLLMIAISSFGVGTVFIKAVLPNADSYVCCTFQLLGASLYSTVFSFLYLGYSSLCDILFNQISFKDYIWPFILGVCYTCLTAFLFMYVILTLGTAVAGYANFAQIVIGLIVGIFVLDEWKGYTIIDKLLSTVGLCLISFSIYFGFKSMKRAVKVPQAMKSDSMFEI